VQEDDIFPYGSTEERDRVMGALNKSSSIQVDNVDDIGEAVRSARQAQGLTQRELADVAGVGVRFLSELERGKPTAEVGLVLRVLADVGLGLVLQSPGWSPPADDLLASTSGKGKGES
jgi:HTH-type transcriptional regulator / antitoxin HipB